MSKAFAGGHKGMVYLALLAALLIQSCASNPNSKERTERMENPSPSDYRIAPGDVLEITVYGEEGLQSQELVVRPDGKVSFPLIGDVNAGGLTTSQVKETVEQRVREYIPEAIASVGVRQLGSLQFYVVGRVAKPGMFNVSQPITVLQALALAGGLTPFAHEKTIRIVRNQDGQVMNMLFNYRQVKEGKNLDQNIMLKRGDTVVVP